MQKLGDVCGQHLAEKARIDERVWALDADLADSDGAEHFAHVHPGRFVECGISEQCMISAAAGMAACGLRPWAFSFAAFLCYRAYDQIRIGVSGCNLPVTLVGSHSGGCGGRNGKSHLALNDIAIISTLPNIQVWSPSDPVCLRTTMEDVLRSDCPNYIRLPRSPVASLEDPVGHADWFGEPSSIAFITHGLAVHWAIQAQRALADKGRRIGVLRISKIWPLDYLQAVRGVEEVTHGIVVEDHNTLGGLGSLLKHVGFPARLRIMGWAPSWGGQSGSDVDLRRLAGLATQDIVEAAMAM